MIRVFKHNQSSRKYPYFIAETDDGLFTHLQNISKLNADTETLENNLFRYKFKVSAKYQMLTYRHYEDFENIDDIVLHFKKIYPEEFI